jgi:hypothetical protein
MADNKDERLQLRMEPDLKEWFKVDAASDGGMSHVVRQCVVTRYETKTGKQWKGGSDGQTEDGPGNGVEADCARHGAGTA